MKSVEKLADDYSQRMNDILDLSWRIFKSRFLDGRHQVTKEAPFQHYFANIISTVGESFCTKRDDLFLVDLESKCENIKGKNKYLDISCDFPNQNINCAIELKFKTAQQGAQDIGRIDAFIDIEALELVCRRDYKLGRFYMITNSTAYINPSKKGVGTKFPIHDGALIKPGEYRHDSKGKENVNVSIKNQYNIEWENINEWYFLQLNIDSKDT